MIRYRFDFLHEGSVCYEGDQTAVWMNVAGGDPPASLDAGAAPPTDLGGGDP
jgi:hypothetical protein